MKLDAAIIDHGNRPLIVGSGIAGLSAALAASNAIVITAGGVGEGSSWLAQGGMAAAIGDDDSPTDHAHDTIAVGGGLVDRDIAHLIANSAPDRIAWLDHLGARFDTERSGGLSLGREAGHRTRRVVHAGGDATGAEIMRVLGRATALRGDIDVVMQTLLVDLIRSGDGIVGVLTRTATGQLAAHLGSGVALATGGIGGVYARSTNPTDVTGTGLAAAARQGARLADLEFVQFHPTALAMVDHPAPLISEALRGDGAILIDDSGDRFVARDHPDAELAPRDVVARSIWRRMTEGHRVSLDTRRAIGDEIETRFPSAFTACMDHGIDPRVSPIPVAPAEHFHMGGVAADSSGRSSEPGLWVAGEVASTGVHGANRLASNSLLEGAVIGMRVGMSMTQQLPSARRSHLGVPVGSLRRAAYPDHQVHDVRRITWSGLGIIRDEQGLEHTLDALDALPGHRSDAAQIAGLMAHSALDRRESRGAHHRADHPDLSPQGSQRSFVTPTASDFDVLTIDRAIAS